MSSADVTAFLSGLVVIGAIVLIAYAAEQIAMTHLSRRPPQPPPASTPTDAIADEVRLRLAPIADRLTDLELTVEAILNDLDLDTDPTDLTPIELTLDEFHLRAVEDELPDGPFEVTLDPDE